MIQGCIITCSAKREGNWEWAHGDSLRCFFLR